MSTDTLLELAINNSVDAHLNTMLTDMKTLLEAVPPKMLENAQLSNLVAVAQDTTSVEVVTNYIRYQMGRDEKGLSWRKRVGRDPFGEQLIAAIDGLRDPAKSFVAENGRRLNLTLTPEEEEGHIDRTWISLTRLYAGYMRRLLYYQNSVPAAREGQRER